jgi:probable HAF family extracellular repeat protein
VIVGHAGTDPYDPLALPLAIARGRARYFEQPLGSLNFALGAGENGLTLGTSASLPVAWRAGSIFLPAVGGLQNGAAYDANTSGQICGTLYNDLVGNQIAVVWSGDYSSGIQLVHGAGVGGAAFAINEAGWVAGAIEQAAGSFPIAARWENHAQPAILLGVLPGADVSEVRCINTHGDTAGRSSFPTFTSEAMLHIRATNTLVPLGTLGGPWSEARGVNDAQQVVGMVNVAGQAHGFLWEQGQMHDLNSLIVSSSEPFVYVTGAVAIDNVGRIAVEVLVPTPIGPVSRIGLLMP